MTQLSLIGRTEPLFTKDIQRQEDALLKAVSTSRFLVLGGAGSIGQAVTKEIFKRNPKKLHVVDISENNMVELVRDLRSSFGYIDGDFQTFALDIGSVEYDAFIESDGKYDYVLNLSALKHVRSEKDPFTLMRMIDVNVFNTEKTVLQAFEKGTKKEREDGFWQRVVKYWKEALNIHHIDTPDEVGDGIRNPWSAAFISWIMTKAGAADKFKRDASHSVYIRDSVKKRKDQVINAPFVAFKIDEVTPEIGDLVCAPRQSGVTYDTTDNYISHCDLVVAKRTNEIDIIGGNVSDSVTQKTLKLDTNGKVKDTTRPWFVVIKNLL